MEDHDGEGSGAVSGEEKVLDVEHDSKRLERVSYCDVIRSHRSQPFDPSCLSSSPCWPSTDDAAHLLSFMQDVFQMKAEDIKQRTRSHPAAKTIEAWQPFQSHLFPTAWMCKNLFIKNKMIEPSDPYFLWLVIARHDTEVDMKTFTKFLNLKSGALRFAGEDVLNETLRVPQGSVTPLALYHDREKPRVNLVLDKRMFEGTEIDPELHELVLKLIASTKQPEKKSKKGKDHSKKETTEQSDDASTPSLSISASSGNPTTDDALPLLLFHPLTNEFTTALRARELLCFVLATKHTPWILDFSAVY